MIITLDEERPPKTQTLHAVEYDAAGRTIVRLVPETLVEAENLMLTELGVLPRDRTPVGITTSRAIGFPAWVIMTDPDNAARALSLVEELEWARRRAGKKKKQVKDRFDELAIELAESVPHFLPSFLEEGARIFAREEVDSYAKQLFGKAREAEKTHGLEIDAERHRAAFEEFGAMGVVGNKELTAEAKSAMDRYADPADAFDHVVGINAERCRGGAEPYLNLLKDLRRAGKMAGLSAPEADDRVFEAVLGTHGFHHTPRGTLEELRPSLVRHCRTRPATQDILLATPLQAVPADYSLALLADAGALDRVREDPQRWAAWLLNFLVGLQQGPRGQGLLLQEIVAAGERLRGAELQLNLATFSLNVLDALLEFGVQLKDPTPWSPRTFKIGWEEWARTRDSRRPLRFLAQDPELGARMVDYLPVSFFSGPPGTDPDYQALKNLFRQRITIPKTFNDPDDIRRVVRLIRETARVGGRHVVDYFPEEVAVMMDLEPAVVLAEVIRAPTSGLSGAQARAYTAAQAQALLDSSHLIEGTATRDHDRDLAASQLGDGHPHGLPEILAPLLSAVHQLSVSQATLRRSINRT